jgi:hypothetical protein
MTQFYVSPTGNDTNDGLTPATPFLTLDVASRKLAAGDTLNLMGGVYNSFPSMRSDTGGTWKSGTAANPILWRPYLNEVPVISSTPVASMKVMDYITMQGIVFDKIRGIKLQTSCNNWTFRDCTFKNSHGSDVTIGLVSAVNTTNLLVEDCVFDNIRSRTFGQDAHAIHFAQNQSNAVVRRCTFTDIGADGVHVDRDCNSTNLRVEECRFEIIRPYQYRDTSGQPQPDPLGIINCGENGVDVKSGDVTIEDCEFIGFRPADGATQDASGGFRGAGIQLHILNDGGYVRRCLFENNGYHLNGGNGLSTNNLTEVSNCIFRNLVDSFDEFYPPGTTERPSAIRLFKQDGIIIENNTFYTDTPDRVNILDLDTEVANLTFRNNSCDEGQIWTRNGAGEPTGTNNIDYNMWSNLAATRPAYFQGANDVDTTNTGIAYNAGYYPANGSAGTGQGVDAGYATDFYGTPITTFDIGAVQARDVPPPSGGSDVEFAVTTVTVPAGGTGTLSQATVPGFGTPKACIVIASQASSDNTIGADSLLSVGFADGTSEWAQSMCSADDESPTLNDRGTRTDAVYIQTDGTGNKGRMGFDSFITDGVQFANRATLTVLAKLTVILIKGTDISNVTVGQTTVPLSTDGTQVVTGLGFEPDLMFTTWNGMPAINRNNFNLHSFGVVLNDAGLPQGCIGGSSANGQTASDAVGTVTSGWITSKVNSDTITQNTRTRISAFSSDGFTLQKDGSSSTQDEFVGFLAIKFNPANKPDLAIFPTTIPTTGGYSETSPGFLPDFGLLLTSGEATVDGGVHAGYSNSIAAFDSSIIRTVSATDERDANPSNAKSVASPALRLLNGDGATYDVVSSGYTLTASGWDFSLTTNPVAPVLGIGFAVGSGAVASTPPTVDAGGPYSGTVGTPIQLDGTVTPGSDLTPTLQWVSVPGGSGTFSDATIADPTFTPTQVNSSYVLRLIVTPSDGSPVSDDAILDSTAVPPVVITDALIRTEDNDWFSVLGPWRTDENGDISNSNTGNVGIGATTPNGRLHVNTLASESTGLWVGRDAGSGQGVSLWGDAVGNYIKGVGPKNLYIQNTEFDIRLESQRDVLVLTANSERMRIDANGIVSGMVSDNSVSNPNSKLVSLTQAEYDALTPDPDTIYFVV